MTLSQNWHFLVQTMELQSKSQNSSYCEAEFSNTELIR